MGPSRGDKSLLSPGHPVLPSISEGYPEPQGRYPCLTAPYAGCHCWHPRLACLIHAANVRSEPGSNPSKVFSMPLSGHTFVAFGPLFDTTQRTCLIPRTRLSPPPCSRPGWVVPPSGTLPHPIGSRQQLVKDRHCDRVELSFPADTTAAQR